MLDREDVESVANLSRRGWLRTAAAGASALGGLAGPWGDRSRWAGAAEAGAGPSMIVRSSRPLDLESPVEVFDQFLTPNDLFFVRSHFGSPAVTLGPWRLEVRGLVRQPIALGLDDLAAMEQVEAPAVLQCAGNGRANFQPTIPGVGWDRGAVGNAEWSGVRLADLLRRAGLEPGDGHVHLLGADAPPSIKTPAYLRSIPIARAMEPDVLVATRMNGEPLPVLHGGPIRLVVPGWAGNHWLKWLRTISVAREEAPGTYQQAGYRMPKVPAPPGAVLKPDDLVPVTTMPIKSLIARPTAGARLAASGPIEVRGVAWTGEGHVTKVEVAIGPDGPWHPADFLNEPLPGSWRLWRWDWEGARPGRARLRVRATDSNGRVQPEASPWNKSGYLWNGIDVVECEVV